MQPIKRFWLRMNVLARAVLSDLFGEGDLPGQVPGGAVEQDLAGPAAALNELETRLSEILNALAGLTAIQRQADHDHQAVLQALAGLEEEIDRAIQQGHDDQARDLLERRARLESRAAELANRCAEQAALVSQARTGADHLRARIAAARQQAADVAGRAASAAALEDLQRLQRAATRDLAHLREQLDQRAEQAGRRTDRAAAWQDLGKDEPWRP